MTTYEETRLYYEDLLLSNQLDFDEEEHKYTVDEKELTSVTTFVSWFFKPFDAEAISTKLEKRTGKAAKDYRKEWRATADFGTKVHEEIELNEHPDQVETPQSKYGLEFMQGLKPLKNVILEFPEVRLFSKELGLAGTADVILVTEDSQIILVDWKTSKSISRKAWNNKTGIRKSTSNVLDSKYNKYRLQLSVYARLLRDMGEEVQELVLVHLTPNGFVYYSMEEQEELVEEMLKEWRENNE